MYQAKRLAIVISHPIQHFVSFFRALARVPALQVKVFFGSKIGVKAYFDEQFRTVIKWSGNLLDGYDYVFLPGAESRDDVGFWTIDNPVREDLLAFRPDVVLTYGYGHVLTLKAIALCRMYRIPVLTISDSELDRERSLEGDYKGSLSAHSLPADFGVSDLGRYE